MNKSPQTLINCNTTYKEDLGKTDSGPREDCKIKQFYSYQKPSYSFDSQHDVNIYSHELILINKYKLSR